MEDERIPRLCHIHRWKDVEGYGFNLHALSTKAIHLIGEIDEGSPAEAGGLQPGDVIVEVNGASVEGESHENLISTIVRDPAQVRMLVVSHLGYEYYQEKGIPITSSLPQVRVMKCPQTNPAGELCSPCRQSHSQSGKRNCYTMS